MSPLLGAIPTTSAAMPGMLAAWMSASGWRESSAAWNRYIQSTTSGAVTSSASTMMPSCVENPVAARSASSSFTASPFGDTQCSTSVSIGMRSSRTNPAPAATTPTASTPMTTGRDSVVRRITARSMRPGREVSEGRVPRSTWIRMVSGNTMAAETRMTTPRHSSTPKSRIIGTGDSRSARKPDAPATIATVRGVAILVMAVRAASAVESPAARCSS